MMIPLRRAFIVKQHGELDVSRGDGLRQGPDRRRAGGLERQDGLRRVRSGVRLPGPDGGAEALARSRPKYQAIKGYKEAVVSREANPILLGVGYIIGFRTSCVMVGGGVLAYLVLVPAIALFGSSGPAPIFPGTKLIAEMDPDEISEGVCPLHRGGGRRHRGDDQPAPGPAADRGLAHGRGSATWCPRDKERQWHTAGPSATCRSGWSASERSALVAAIAATHLMPDNVAGRIVGAVLIVSFRVPVRHGLVAAHGRDRLVVEPDLGDDGGARSS